MPPSLQIDNYHVTVWEDSTTKRSQLSFEYDSALSETWVSLGRGNNGDPVRLTNLAVPVADADATNKAYVDALIRGLTIKAPVRLVEAGNRTLSALVPGATIDSVPLRLNDRVMLIGQTNAVENGIWVIGATEPTRSADLPVGADASAVYAFVDEGTVYMDRSFICITNRVDTNNQLSAIVGTHNLTWVQFGARSTAMAGRGLVTGSANEIDVNVDESTLTINNNYVCIKNPSITVKAERGLIRTTTNGTAVTDVTTDAATASVLGRTVPLGSNVGLRPDFTVIPDLAATNTFTASNTFSQSGNATWTQVGQDEPTLTGSIVLSTGGLAVRQNVVCSSAALHATTESTSTTTGALVVAGGVGAAGNLYVGQGATITGAVSAASASITGDVAAATTHLSGTTDSTSTTTGTLVVAGGVGAAGNLHVGQGATITGAVSAASASITGDVAAATTHLSGTTDSTSTTTGTLVVAGGVGAAGNLHVGQGATITGAVSAASASITGDVAAATTHLSGTTNSTSSTTGTLIVAGGVGVALDVHAGGSVHCDGTTAATWAASAPMTGAIVIEGGAAVRSGVECATAHVNDTGANAFRVEGSATVGTNMSVGGTLTNTGIVYANSTTVSGWQAGAQPTDAPILQGAVQIAGGVAVAAGVHAATLRAHSTTDATSTTTGSVIVDGGLGVAQTVYSTSARVVGTTPATSQTTGALVVSGGAGIAGDLYCQNTYLMSDRRLKKNVEPLTDALDKVCALTGCSFEWNERMSGLENVPSVGVIAQDVLEQAPRCVVHNVETDLYAVGPDSCMSSCLSVPAVFQVGSLSHRVHQDTETPLRRARGGPKRSQATKGGPEAQPQSVRQHICITTDIRQPRKENSYRVAS